MKKKGKTNVKKIKITNRRFVNSFILFYFIKFFFHLFYIYVFMILFLVFQKNHHAPQKEQKVIVPVPVPHKTKLGLT